MRIVVVGSGAREHALCVSLAAGPDTEVICAPGNAGTALVAETRPLELSDNAAIAALAEESAADLVVIGPEVPLVAGAADAVRAAGIPCFGPSRAAARLEGSKDFAKQVMAAAGVPTAAARTCSNPAEAEKALDEFGPPYVVKDDGLAAGKGVVVTPDRAAALAHAAACERVVIEEFLDGPEISLFYFADGTTFRPMLPAQDFKRVGDGDTGPNTGGMGAYAPLDWAPENLVAEVSERVVAPTLAEMERIGAPYSGLLYVGLALTAGGPKVVEFNARFGDPETQVLLPLLDTPLSEVLLAVATGRLAEFPQLSWKDGAAVTVVMASAGYPEAPRSGDEISGADAPGVLHAGTRRDAGGRLLTAGGRVLSVTATGDSLPAARAAAYAQVGRIAFAGAHYRSDIAAR